MMLGYRGSCLNYCVWRCSVYAWNMRLMFWRISILCLAAMFCLDMDRNFIMRTWNWNAYVYLKKKVQLKSYNGVNINEEMVGIDMFNLWLYKFDEWVNQCCMNNSYWIKGLVYFSFSFSVCCHCWFAFADLSPI